MLTTYSDISNYWNSNPCSGGDNKFPFWRTKGKKVLEIGFGGGVDAERFVNAGAIYTGIDLTKKAWWLTKQKIGDKGKLLIMNAEELDFHSYSFDFVYSFGVIHHALDPEKIIKEVHRVLATNGVAFIMLYGKPSIRYNLDIMFFRKILWHLNFYKYRELKKEFPNPTKEQWISMNTDTLGCPMARVYTRKEAISMFTDFRAISCFSTNYGWFLRITAVK